MEEACSVPAMFLSSRETRPKTYQGVSDGPSVRGVVSIEKIAGPIKRIVLLFI